jgi:hypothetical protein
MATFRSDSSGFRFSASSCLTYYFSAAADFTLIWSPAALATVQPFYPLQFFWSRAKFSYEPR